MVSVKRSRTAAPASRSLQTRGTVTKRSKSSSAEPAETAHFACYVEGCGKLFTKKWNLKSTKSTPKLSQCRRNAPFSTGVAGERILTSGFHSPPFRATRVGLVATDHFRIHTGAKPYPCREGCGQSFMWMSSRKSHEGHCRKQNDGLEPQSSSSSGTSSLVDSTSSVSTETASIRTVSGSADHGLLEQFSPHLLDAIFTHEREPPLQCSTASSRVLDLRLPAPNASALHGQGMESRTDGFKKDDPYAGSVAIWSADDGYSLAPEMALDLLLCPSWASAASAANHMADFDFV
jgi:hypothetical protein